jgi:dihydrolipoyl dehydrogenase
LENAFMSASKTYDIAIIGSGPGGYVAAVRAAQLGLSVLIVEKDAQLGGVCTLRGCIPTKALLHTADLLDEVRRGAELGVVAPEVRLDFAAAMKFKSKVVRQSSNGVSYLMKKNKVDVVQGFGSLEGPGRLRIIAADGSATSAAARNVLIATGSAPRSIPGVEIDGDRIISSDHVLELSAPPTSMIVLGAGAVGVEFASMYSRFGSQCTLVELLPRVVPLEDEEISAELARSFKRQGIHVLVETKVEKVHRTDRGVEVAARAASGKTESLSAEKLLVAVGRQPLTDKLGLEKAGVAIERGYVVVDKYMRTNVPGIYAIGDIVTTPWLAHVASMEGVVAVESMAGRDTVPLNYDQVPACTYCSPEIASIGLTEAKARERGHQVRVGKFPFSAIGKARILNDTEGFVKIVADARYDEILGVHMIGPRVTETIAEACSAMRLEATSEDLVRTIHAHPTLAEAVHEAAEAVRGHAIHI